MKPIPAINSFFLSRGFRVPWDKIALVKDGWAIPWGRLFAGPGRVTVTLPLGGLYQIHYQEPLEEAVLVHEITHIWQSYRVRGWVLKYLMEHLAKGYQGNRYEVEAEKIEAEFRGR